MQNTLPTKPPGLRQLCAHARRLAVPSLMFLAALPVYAQSASDPWDNAVNVLKTAFTGTIATGLSLVAIVVGGLMFAYGEGQSKRMLAGIIFGIGMAVGAVKFTAFHWRMEDMVSRGVLTSVAADQLQAQVIRGDNILISGGTNCGKTTMLNVMADAIPEEERILVIEDTAELRIHKPHVVQLEAQVHTHKQTVTFDDLLKATLRHRPDRILVGEVRGPEARTLLDAMNTGHRGTLATIHANNAEAALQRLAMLAARGAGTYDRRSVESEIASAISTVVHLGRSYSRRFVQEILDCSQRRTER